MKVQIEDFGTGWFGITMGIKKAEIDILIEGLRSLKTNQSQHFHIMSNYEGGGGVGDIELFIEDENVPDNSTINLSPAVTPNR